MFRFYISRHKVQRSNVADRNALRSFHFEQLESRQLMAAEISPNVLNPGFEGSIVLDPTTRILTIKGSQTKTNTVNVSFQKASDTTFAQLNITLSNNLLSRIASFDPATVKQVNFNGGEANDRFDNRTFVPSWVDGGLGNDVILGGYANDILIGREGNDYIDGRRGNDQLFGYAGNDVIFGDDGQDWIHGGDQTDFLFGGNGNDEINGNNGDDILYGGAGTDRISDPSGTNTIYADYGNATSITSSGFRGFDWFDQNLKDSNVRSLVREAYRDSLIVRTEMLRIYSAIADENYDIIHLPFGPRAVSPNELADLKAMLTTKLSFESDTRYFANKIANGDPANALYQSTPLGNLNSRSSALQLNRLVDKWFLGGDVPEIAPAHQAIAQYTTVNGPLFQNGAHHEDIDQGGIGDCYFLAAIGEIAFRKPHKITEMFKDNGDGTFTIKFVVNNAPAWVTVNRQLPVLTTTQRAIYADWGGGTATSNSNELWVALAEKAYAQLNASGNIGQDGTNTYVGIAFGTTAKVFLHLLGRTATTHNIESNGAAVMISALSSGKGVTLSTKNTDTNPNITPNHAYLVTGYNEVTKRFTIFNPHGFDGSRPAYLQVSWNAIMDNFDGWTSVTI